MTFPRAISPVTTTSFSVASSSSRIPSSSSIPVPLTRTPSPARKPAPMPVPRRATRVPVTSAHCSWAALYCFRVWLWVSSQSMPS